MYRKLTAPQIFNGYEILPAGNVLILDHKGTIIDIVNKMDAGDDIEWQEGILSPGFINAHCHLELSHLKGIIPKHTGLVDFVLQIVEGRKSSESAIFEAIENAEAEMKKNGIVAVGDICNTNHTITQKTKNNLYYHNFLEASGFPKNAATPRFSIIENLYHQFAEKLEHHSIVPHAPYSVSTDLLEKITHFHGNEIITMHNQETEEENEWFKNKSGGFLKLYNHLNIDTSSFDSRGESSLRHFLPYFKTGNPLILVHNLFTNEEDIAAAKIIFNQECSNLYFCLCPNANVYISNKLPDINLFVRNQCNIVLGTDSLASNDQLSILEEINTLQKAYPDLSLSEMLKWATSNGAKALKIDDKYGSFEKGKTPGVVLIQNESVVNLEV